MAIISYMGQPGAGMNFHFKIICRSGVVYQAANSDFLPLIFSAKEQKQVWQRELPHSRVRVQLFYPNGKRVPSADIGAAMRALADPNVAAAVQRRHAAAAQIPASRSEARTAGICTAAAALLASAVDVDFCQAGEVAPPDSPDLGNLAICDSSVLIS